MQHFAEDPLNFVGDVRARTANEILKGFRDVQRKEPLLKVPILAIHGTADKITSYTVRVLGKPLRCLRCAPLVEHSSRTMFELECMANITSGPLRRASCSCNTSVRG